MVIEVSSDSGHSKRYFHGLKANGNYLFNNDDTHQYILTIPDLENDGKNTRFYAENFCVKIKDDDKLNEYIVSLANEGQYCELYDFEEGKVHQIKSEKITTLPINSIRHSSANLIKDGEYYIVFYHGFIIIQLIFSKLK